MLQIKNVNLNVSVDNGEHSQYYIENKRPGADIYEFEVPKWCARAERSR